MCKLNINKNLTEENVINSKNISIMCDDRCCGHCRYYDGNGYCSDGTAVRSSDWCNDFKWAK